MLHISCDCKDLRSTEDILTVEFEVKDKLFVLIRQYKVRNKICSNCQNFKEEISRYLIKDSFYFDKDHKILETEIEEIKHFDKVRKILMKFKSQDSVSWSVIMKKYPGEFFEIFNDLWYKGFIIYERKKINKNLKLPDEDSIPDYLFKTPSSNHYKIQRIYLTRSGRYVLTNQLGWDNKNINGDLCKKRLNRILTTNTPPFQEHRLEYIHDILVSLNRNFMNNQFEFENRLLKKGKVIFDMNYDSFLIIVMILEKLFTTITNQNILSKDKFLENFSITFVSRYSYYLLKIQEILGFDIGIFNVIRDDLRNEKNKTSIKKKVEYLIDDFEINIRNYLAEAILMSLKSHKSKPILNLRYIKDKLRSGRSELKKSDYKTSFINKFQTIKVDQIVDNKLSDLDSMEIINLIVDEMNWSDYAKIINQLNLFSFSNHIDKLNYIKGGRNIFKHIKRNIRRELNHLFKIMFEFYSKIYNYNTRYVF